MNEDKIDELLLKYKEGNRSTSEIKKAIIEQITSHINSEVVFDINRESISGVPEVIFAETKDPELCIKITTKVVQEKGVILLSRCLKNHFNAFNDWVNHTDYILEMNERARTILVYTKDYKFESDPKKGLVALITAGTTDIPIAEEAANTLKLMNVAFKSFYDIGIAGLHRLQNPLKEIKKLKPDCIVVFAGMEGALPSVIASLVNIPIIGVPISAGSYGYGSGGETALKSMLQTCSPGIAVVNIDGGFRAATIAGLIAKGAHKEKTT